MEVIVISVGFGDYHYPVGVYESKAQADAATAPDPDRWFEATPEELEEEWESRPGYLFPEGVPLPDREDVFPGDTSARFTLDATPARLVRSPGPNDLPRHLRKPAP